MNKLILGFAATVFAANAIAATASTTAASVAPAAQSTSVSMSAATAAPSAKKITLSYLAENSVGARAANTSNWDGAVESQQHIGLAYNLGNDKTIQYRQYFLYNMTDAVKKDETSIGDHVIQYSDSTAAKIADANMAFAARAYAPGTEANREIGRYELRLTETVKQQVTGKMSLEYALGSRFYTYSGDNSGQRGLRVIPAISAEYQLNKIFSPNVAVMTDHGWFNSGRGASQKANPANYTEDVLVDVGTGIAVAKGISLSAYVETSKNLRASSNFYMFNEATSSYNLVLSASM